MRNRLNFIQQPWMGENISVCLMVSVLPADFLLGPIGELMPKNFSWGGYPGFSHPIDIVIGFTEGRKSTQN
jgi:hypothetical protein